MPGYCKINASSLAPKTKQVNLIGHFTCRQHIKIIPLFLGTNQPPLDKDLGCIYRLSRLSKGELSGKVLQLLLHPFSSMMTNSHFQQQLTAIKGQGKQDLSLIRINNLNLAITRSKSNKSSVIVQSPRNENSYVWPTVMRCIYPTTKERWLIGLL